MYLCIYMYVCVCVCVYICKAACTCVKETLNVCQDRYTGRCIVCVCSAWVRLCLWIWKFVCKIASV